MTIVESIKCVLQQNNDGLTSKQIYDEIIRQGLYSFGAENPVGVVNAQLRRRCIGLDFPTAYPIKFFEIAGYEGKKIKFRLISTENTATIITAPKTTDISELLPEEKIKAALQEHLQNIRQQVFDSVLNNSPEFFEHLVVDLLLKMGYGYDKNSGIVTGKPHDGGIDGIISEDKLGLDLIYIQAKRFANGNKVTRHDLQAFIGAMEHINKGVFITTSSFTRSAIQFIEKQQQKNIKLIDEHFFYCDLYLPREGDCEYSTLKFGENFCLTSGFESGSTKYYEGSHLIEAIRDRDYLQNVLSRLNKCVEIMTDIIESEGPSTPFKDKFICAKKVDSIDIQNCHSMLKKILMEKEVIPKILALKYILTYFDGKPHAKEEYKSVYSVFCAAVLFTVFANKKESDTFYNFVRLEEWKSKINKWLYDYISSHALTRGKVLAAYKYSESDDDPIQQIRCKSLAAISNFFKVTKNGDNYNMGISNAAELCKFFGDKTVYSLEHFIVGECGTLHVKTAKYDFPYKYPPTIQKYRNSLFNFIFIPQPLNSSLSNEGLFIKVAEIHTHENEIKCSYSKGYYGLLNKSPRMYFQRYPTEKEIDSFSTEEDARAYLNEYFTKTFPEEFLQFSTALVKKINWGS